MQISNLGELLNATLIHEGNVLSVENFTLNVDKVKQSFAFFSNDEEAIEKAIKNGAFAIITEKSVRISDDEIFYFKVDSLKIALLRLLRFLCDEKKCNFLLCSEQELHFCEVFYMKKLSKDIFIDFENLIHAKTEDYFCCEDEDYLLKLCANYDTLKTGVYKDLSHSSLFFSSFICENLYFKNLQLPFFYKQIFSNFITFLKSKTQNNIKFNLNKLNHFGIYFVNSNMEITNFGASSRVFITVSDEKDFDFFESKLKNITHFKTALKNSLFCDFSYEKLEDLKNMKNFNYCLILVNQKDFENTFNKKQNDEVLLFDIHSF